MTPCRHRRPGTLVEFPAVPGKPTIWREICACGAWRITDASRLDPVRGPWLETGLEAADTVIAHGVQ
jgi:hypothetical protein